MDNRTTYTYFSEYFQIALGIFLASIGLKAFLLPNDFLDGGVTGTAILVNSQFENLNISTLLVLINIPFLILAYFTLSKRILVKSIFSIIGLALVIHFVEFDVATDDKLLISIFGGLFVGSGIGLTVKNGAVLDGSEILGVFLNDRFGFSIGQIILYFNIVLFSITALVLSVEIAMYSILTYIVTAKVIDLFIEGFEDFIGIMIVIIGVILLFSEKLPFNLGKLPGDIAIKKENFSFYFPITTSILISIVLSLLFYFFSKFYK